MTIAEIIVVALAVVGVALGIAGQLIENRKPALGRELEAWALVFCAAWFVAILAYAATVS